MAFWRMAVAGIVLLSGYGVASTQRRVVDVAGLPMEMVFIPGGCFTLGSPHGEEGRTRAEQQRQVCVPAFWMGVTEVTNAQYARFDSAHRSGSYRGHSLEGENQPVVGVNASEAAAFAHWLSSTDGRPLRLPTAAQWEYAARAGTHTARFWGEDPAQACLHANGHDRTSARLFPSFTWQSHPCDDGHGVTAPVGSFLPNPWGLHDMLGNVWEWTCSAWEFEQGRVDEQCAREGRLNGFQVIKGGSWVNQPSRVRAAFADHPNLASRYHSVGFRLVMEE